MKELNTNRITILLSKSTDGLSCRMDGEVKLEDFAEMRSHTITLSAEMTEIIEGYINDVAIPFFMAQEGL